MTNLLFYISTIKQIYVLNRYKYSLAGLLLMIFQQWFIF